MVGNLKHTIDPTMQATDHTPPDLPAIPPAQVHFGDGSSQGCLTRSDCAGVGSISIATAATDDMTMPAKIGYRFSLADGRLPAGLTLPTEALDPEGTFFLLYFDADTVDSLDFTLQVVAIDLAGNESAPQTVLVRDSSGNACSVAHGRRPGYAVAWIAIGALALAARRRPRRRTLTWIQCARRWTGLSASEAQSASSSSA